MGVGIPQVHGQADMVLDHSLQLPGAPSYLLEVVGAHMEKDSSWSLLRGTAGDFCPQNLKCENDHSLLAFLNSMMQASRIAYLVQYMLLLFTMVTTVAAVFSFQQVYYNITL